MKGISALLFAAFLLAPAAGADTLIRIEEHTDGYYLGGTTTPAVDEVVQLWFGPRRLAVVTPIHTLLVDEERGRLAFLNHREKSYAETPLPLDRAKFFSAEELGVLQLYARQGTVKPTAETRKVGEWNCRGWEVNDWIPYEGSKFSEREIRLWSSTEVPCDWRRLRELYQVYRQLANLGEAYLKDLAGVEGFWVLSEETRYMEGLAIRSTSRATSIAEQEPPAGLFAPPEGYTKKDLLSIQDLQD